MACKNLSMVNPILKKKKKKKKKIKKIKAVINLGERMEFEPSFFAFIAPRLSSKDESKLKAAETMESDGEEKNHKVMNPQSLSEYRHICLVGSLYKILVKILVARLRSVIGKLVSTNQMAFVPGRFILDGVIVRT